MGDRKKKEEFLKRHKSLTTEEIGKQLREMETAKKQFETDAASLEQNIKSFNLMTDPLVDPVSGKALCWIRRPTQGELEKLLPTELLQYKRVEDIPEDVQKQYADHQFKMMAQLVEKPKHDTKWWKQNANLVFQELFQLHLVEIYKKLGLLIENF